MASGHDAECCFAAGAILKRMEAAVRQKEAVVENRDVEAVHDMRVASRRLRTALGLFEDCLPAKKGRTWGKAIRRVTRALGQARDCDVQIETVREFLKGVRDRPLRPGIRRLLLRLGQQREGLQEGVVESLERLDASGAFAEMREVLGPVQAHGQLQHIGTDEAGLRSRAGAAIAERLEQMLAYEPYVRQPEAVAQLHAMRIGAKHLRYAMEVFRPIYGEALEAAIQTVRQVQQQLGEIHDCDVWVVFLPEFLEQERKRTVEYFGSGRALGRLVAGIEHLRADRQRHRERCYGQFVECWEGLGRQNTWGELYRMVGPGVMVPGERPTRVEQEPSG